MPAEPQKLPSETMNPAPLIVIDGPVGSGKDTVCNQLAESLGGVHLTGGSFYRTIGLFCLLQKIDVNNHESVEENLPRFSMRYDNGNVFLRNGEHEIDVTMRIKEQDVANIASKIAAIPMAQDKAIRLQQEAGRTIIARGKAVIIDGRNAGTEIFPDAQAKFFLTADHIKRGERKWLQLPKIDQTPEKLEEMITDIKERDYRDSHRANKPMTMDPEKDGYIIIDNSKMDREETLHAIISELEKRKLV